MVKWRSILNWTLLTTFAFGGVSGDYLNRTPSRDLEAKSIVSYQNKFNAAIEEEIQKLVAQREKARWENIRASKDAKIVQFVSLGDERIRVESTVQEYFKKKRIKHIDDSSWEKVFEYIEPEDKVVKEVLTKLKIPSDSLEKDAQRILDFTQKGFIYLEEKDSYPKSPLETIVEGGGDCEDLFLLTASLMKGAEMDIIYIALPGKERVISQNSSIF